MTIEVESARGGGQEGAPEPLSLPDRLPVLPLRDSVTFPDTLTPLAVGQERSVQLVNDVLGGDRMLVMVAGRDPEVEEPRPDQLFGVGVVGTVARMMRVPDGTLRILVQGGQRVRLTGFETEQPYLVAGVQEAPDVVREGPELTALTRNVQATFTSIIAQVPYLPEELQLAVANLEDPSALSHLIAGSLRIKTAEKQELLEQVDVSARLRQLAEILARELEVVNIGSQIQSQVQSELDKTQREFVLRQQLKAIQDELGERDPTEAEVEDLREQIAQRRAARRRARPGRPRARAARAAARRRRPSTASSAPTSSGSRRSRGPSRPRTTSTSRTRARCSTPTTTTSSGSRTASSSSSRSAGSSRTPAARSCASSARPASARPRSGTRSPRALGRRFERISVGGVRDESEIRGHRRTYIGAMPGTIVRALRDAGSNNPLFMIDEIDKMGSDFRGDPASAMLEVLDPEQNATFRDHYLDVPFDLSHVMFVTHREHAGDGAGAAARPHGGHPARRLHRGGEAPDRPPLPRGAPDRAQRPAALADRASPTRACARSSPTTRARPACATSSARSAPSAARSPAGSPRATPGGRSRSPARACASCWAARASWPTGALRTAAPGVATGLAWTPVGGDVLFVEAGAMPGSGKLTITGQLGDVMRESAQAALSYVRGHAGELAPGLAEDWFATHDVHLHVPAGAVPKDGPSAGVTMVTALTSLISGRPVRADVAMTGEITLTGKVLPIGGLKEKALAAQRAGVTRVIAPARNEPDLEDLPEALREGVEFVWADEVGDVLEAALESLAHPDRGLVGMLARKDPTAHR